MDFVNTCQQCGRKFITSRSHRDQKFCSQLCYGRFKSKQKPPAENKIKQCERCGKDFEVKANVAHRAKFCPECRVLVRRERERERNRRFCAEHPDKVKEYRKAQKKALEEAKKKPLGQGT